MADEAELDLDADEAGEELAADVLVGLDALDDAEEEESLVVAESIVALPTVP